MSKKQKKQKKDKSTKAFEKFFYSQDGITPKHYNAESSLYKAQKRCWDYVISNYELYER